MAKWRVEKSRDAADWEFQWVTISPNRKYLDWSSWGRAMGYVKYEISKERKATAKTLADMTTEERADCVGMWCDNLESTAGNPNPVVLACVLGEQCWILHTDLYGEWSRFPLGSVSPRFDLPRAWTPDGEPIPGEWEEDNE